MRWPDYRGKSRPQILFSGSFLEQKLFERFFCAHLPQGLGHRQISPSLSYLRDMTFLACGASVTSSIVPNVIRVYPPCRPARSASPALVVPSVCAIGYWQVHRFTMCRFLFYLLGVLYRSSSISPESHSGHPSRLLLFVMCAGRQTRDRYCLAASFVLPWRIALTWQSERKEPWGT